jgi:hypothetical protein
VSTSCGRKINNKGTGERSFFIRIALVCADMSALSEAVPERPAFDTRDSVRDYDAEQTPALGESQTPNAGEGLGKRDVSKALARTEGFVSNSGNVPAHRDSCQADAAFERLGPDSGDPQAVYRAGMFTCPSRPM